MRTPQNEAGLEVWPSAILGLGESGRPRKSIDERASGGVSPVREIRSKTLGSSPPEINRPKRAQIIWYDRPRDYSKFPEKGVAPLHRE